MKKKWLRLAGIGLAVAMAMPIFAACTPGENPNNPDDPDINDDPIGGDPTQLNENRALQISSGAFDQVFNPFFATSQYDANVVGQTQIGMLGSDENGMNVTYGVNEPVVTLDYSEIMYTATNQVTTNGESADRTVYQFVIKNDILFSDGVPLTAHDVLFNLYMYLDPNYTGSNTLYSTDIVGLREYTTQNPNATESSASSFDETYNTLARQRAYAIIYYADDPDDTSTWQSFVNTYNSQRRRLFENYDADNSASNGGNRITDLFVAYNEAAIQADIEKIKTEFRNELQTTYNGIDMNTYRGTQDPDTKEYSDGYDLDFTDDDSKNWQGFFLELGLISRTPDPADLSGTVFLKNADGEYVIDWQGIDRNEDFTMEEAIDWGEQ